MGRAKLLYSTPVNQLNIMWWWRWSVGCCCYSPDQPSLVTREQVVLSDQWGETGDAATLLWKFLSRKATTKWWETREVQPAKIFQSAQTDGAEYSTIWYLCHYGIRAALIDSFYSFPPRCHKDNAKIKKWSYWGALPRESNIKAMLEVF